AGYTRNRRRRWCQRRPVRHRCGRGTSDLASALRQHAREARRDQRYALPGWPDRGADDGGNVAWEVHRVRGVMGWTAAAGEPRGWRGRRPPREIRRRGGEALADNSG